MTKDSALASKINVVTETKSNKEEIITQIQMTTFSTESTEILGRFSNLTQIDELIEQGFKEKYSDHFERAAYFFFKALSLDPIH